MDNYDEESDYDDDEVSDFEYTADCVSMGYFEGIEFDVVWECLYMAKTVEEFDAAICATIDLQILVDTYERN